VPKIKDRKVSFRTKSNEQSRLEQRDRLKRLHDARETRSHATYMFAFIFIEREDAKRRSNYGKLCTRIICSVLSRVAKPLPHYARFRDGKPFDCGRIKAKANSLKRTECLTDFYVNRIRQLGSGKHQVSSRERLPDIFSSSSFVVVRAF